jgi:DNA polymerase I
VSINDLLVFLAGDYSGIEVRILAEASGDPLLISQFNSGYDVHSLVGHELTGWPKERIRTDKVTRTAVKEFHFGVIFGLGRENGHKNLQAKGVKITQRQFMSYHDRYFQRYRMVKKFVDRCHKDVEYRHKVETIFGFVRRITSNDTRRTSYYLNQAVNTPIQSAAHTLVLTAMALLRLKKTKYNLLQRPVMEVHDELVFRVRLGDLVEADTMLRQLLEKEVYSYIAEHFGRKLRVPLVAETEAGFTRGSMVTYEDKPVPSVQQFLKDWRKKHHDVISKPLEELIPTKFV